MFFLAAKYPNNWALSTSFIVLDYALISLTFSIIGSLIPQYKGRFQQHFSSWLAANIGI